MTKNIKIQASKRNEKENLGEIRKKAHVPGIIYGPDLKNTLLSMKRNDLEKVFASAGESSLVNLSIDGGNEIKVIIKNVQIDPIKDTMTHVDFYAVDMKKPIEVELPINFIGESITEKDNSAVVVKNMESVNVRCLPANLLENIDLDMTKLEKIGDVLRIADLDLPKEIEVLSSLDDSIISVSEVQEEKEEEPVQSDSGEESDESGEESEATKSDSGTKSSKEEKPSEDDKNTK